MKKIISVILCIAMLVSVVAIPSFAAKTDVKSGTMESVFAEGKDSLIVFVTGIGQSRSYSFDEKYTKEGAFEKGTLQDYENYAPLIANGDFLDRWNLFEPSFDAKAVVSIVVLLAEMIFYRVTGIRIISDRTIGAVVSSIFKYNICDEEGNLPANVVTPRYPMPVSEYPGITEEDGTFFSEAKARFYSSIPCEEIAKEKFGDDFEDHIYCFNFPTFSFIQKNVAALHEFIETILKENKLGADEVVLVPMSMGASVVSQYLATYPSRADNHVLRVVSIVGCWNGSDVVSDLLRLHYVDNSPEEFYGGLMSEVFNSFLNMEPLGDVIILILRLLPKADIRMFLDQALGIFGQKMLLGASSLTVLIPSYDYDELKDLIKVESVKKETEIYHKAQSTIKERFEKLDKEEGIKFSFISGYGLAFGEQTGDYMGFGFMNSAPKTNSDEVININSTAPGTEYVAPGETFASTDGRILSPDGSIDIANTYYKDSTWFFYKQKHELEYNNTAISLAIELALGRIKTVADCDNADEDAFYYPQFNGARNLKKFNGYVEKLDNYCKSEGYTLTADQQKIYDDAMAMKASRVNDFEKDNALIDQFRGILVDLGLEEDNTPTTADGILAGIGDALTAVAMFIFGPRGYFDWAKTL
ncbi:MAG: alpha/beta hydrolase [Clostridia bacterium]|nr:alpha/beta hydrolase [Clostridia bacterium]